MTDNAKTVLVELPSSYEVRQIIGGKKGSRAMNILKDTMRGNGGNGAIKGFVLSDEEAVELMMLVDGCVAHQLHRGAQGRCYINLNGKRCYLKTVPLKDNLAQGLVNDIVRSATKAVFSDDRRHTLERITWNFNDGFADSDEARQTEDQVKAHLDALIAKRVVTVTNGLYSAVPPSEWHLYWDMLGAA